MTIDQALLHPAVARHPQVRALAKEQARLTKAKAAQTERTRAADAAHRAALAKWSAEHDQAVLDGRPSLPPKPEPQPGTVGQAQALLVNEGQRLAEAARTVLADLAPDLVLKIAAHLDEQLAAVKAGPVGAVPDALGAVNASRRACWDVARCRWSPVQLPTPPEPIDVGQLVTLALGPAGVYGDQWSQVVERDRRRAEDEARQAAEMTALSERAAVQQGKLVQEGLGHPEPLPPEDRRLAGRR